MDFDTLRWKLADDLSPEEAQIIVDNKDKLNDEEKAAFSDLIQQATPLPDNPLEDAIENTVNDEADKEVAKEADTATPAPPAAPAAPQLPDNVVTKDSLDSYIDEKRKEWEAEGKSKAEQDKEEQKIQQYFEDGYTPKDWNEYTNAMVEKVAPVIEQRILKRLDDQNKKFQDEQEKIKKTQKDIFDRFESEFATLAKNNLIPDPAVNREEYEKVRDSIVKIGNENGKTNITDAYKLWSIIPEEHGGGLKTGNSVSPAEQNKQKIDAQKQAASRVGSGRGAPTSVKGGAPTWANIHKTSMDDLIEQRLRQS